MSGYWTELGPLPDAAFENEPASDRLFIRS
jgi:hypothetical protein